MHPKFLARILIALSVFSLGTAFSADKGIGIYFDQDLLLPVVNEDRDYTMGVAVELFDQSSDSLIFDRLLGWLESELYLNRDSVEVARSYVAGSVNYTPQDLSVATPIRVDRPYASLVYFSNKRVIKTPTTAIGVEAQVGLLGTYIARETQESLHRAWRGVTGKDTPVDPKGWSNQISAGGEPTGRLRVSASRLLVEPNDYIDVALDSELSLGYQTNAAVGLSMRAGWLNSRFSSIPYNPINRGNFVPDPASREAYVWGAYRARVIGYDALLQGQFRDSALTYGRDDIERLVHELGIGVTFSPIRETQLTFSANMKTGELKSGIADRTHWWGGTYLMLKF